MLIFLIGAQFSGLSSSHIFLSFQEYTVKDVYSELRELSGQWKIGKFKCKVSHGTLNIRLSWFGWLILQRIIHFYEVV